MPCLDRDLQVLKDVVDQFVPKWQEIIKRVERRRLRISANVTADFGNVTDSAGLGVARCRL